MVKFICAQIAGLTLAVLALAAEPSATAPDLSEARVTLPYQELKALWQAAQRETPEKRKPPVEAALLAARYQLVLKNDQAAGVVEFETQSFTDEWTVIPALALSYTAKKPPFKPVSGQIAVELPQTDLLVHWIDWELRIPVAYEIAAFEGNVESVPGDKTDGGSRVVRLHKELCKNERPRAEFFYQKPQPNK